VFVWKDGSKYEGEWKNGKQSGYGVYTSKFGKTRAGDWKKGKRVQAIDTQLN